MNHNKITLLYYGWRFPVDGVPLYVYRTFVTSTSLRRPMLLVYCKVIISPSTRIRRALVRLNGHFFFSTTLRVLFLYIMPPKRDDLMKWIVFEFKIRCVNKTTGKKRKYTINVEFNFVLVQQDVNNLPPIDNINNNKLINNFII